MESATVSTREPAAGNGARASEHLAQAIERSSWRPADPAPLGLAGFAMTTFVLSMFNANVVSSSGEPAVFGLALAYGGVVQLLAGMWEFRNGNTFGALAFSSFGGFWISLFIFDVFFASSIPAADLGHAAGLYLWAWAIFTTYMFVASLRTTGAVALVFALLAPTYVLLAIGASGGHDTVTHWGGYVGIATAVAAWYASFAAVTNSTFGRTVLPVVPLNREREVVQPRS
jgi:succinate-acetate transporter protein